jgi:hypothetical protein
MVNPRQNIKRNLDLSSQRLCGCPVVCAEIKRSSHASMLARSSKAIMKKSRSRDRDSDFRVCLQSCDRADRRLQPCQESQCDLAGHFGFGAVHHRDFKLEAMDSHPNRTFSQAGFAGCEDAEFPSGLLGFFVEMRDATVDHEEPLAVVLECASGEAHQAVFVFDAAQGGQFLGGSGAVAHDALS